ncbi:hypothetical protein MMC21_002610 [Puttea exsequens]|nr:hypothetical protein [Puttea exsequens]
MAPNIVYLPNGQMLSVSNVFAGLSFKPHDLNVHQSVFPPGWTIILESADSDEDNEGPILDTDDIYSQQRRVHKFRSPTLRGDNLFISSISNPSSTDFKPPTSPSRQIALMLWTTLWWYFHQLPPNPHLTAGISPNIPEKGKPKGEWRVNIKREGIFKGKYLLSKLARMGLIASEESAVGVTENERKGEGFLRMFVSQRAFWQLDPRIFLFTLSPNQHSPFPGGTPFASRPGSPNRESTPMQSPRLDSQTGEPMQQGLWNNQLSGPFSSSSHLPTYYPPTPPQYTFTGVIRHPIRPKPPAQGETFYTRYVPSVGQYISFRTASISVKAPKYRGPVGPVGGGPGTPQFLPPKSGVSTATLPSVGNIDLHPCDTDLLHDWMNQPRVNAFWGAGGPVSNQEEFLSKALNDKHSFPVIGCWDGKPFGYFELYWVKEDQLGRHLTGSDVNDWDRGLHALVGEEEFRGPHRVKVWLSALVHYFWLADPRTMRVLCEPRLDNDKFINYLFDVGFFKEREVKLPHKQAALMKIGRDGWQAPVI